jgi:hypothetical protein
VKTQLQIITTIITIIIIIIINSVEDRGQRERGSGGGSPVVRGSTQFANELNPYSY